MRYIQNQNLREKLRDIESLWQLAGELNSVTEFFLDVLSEVISYTSELETQAATNKELESVIESIDDMVRFYNPKDYQDSDGNFDHESFASDILKNIQKQMRFL